MGVELDLNRGGQRLLLNSIEPPLPADGTEITRTW
jgi:hypothetical protein